MLTKRDVYEMCVICLPHHPAHYPPSLSSISLTFVCLSYTSFYLITLHMTLLPFDSDQSHSAMNIRPAPGQSGFAMGPYEWWEYDCNFFEYSSPSLNLFSPTSHLRYESLCDKSSHNDLTTLPYVLPTLTQYSSPILNLFSPSHLK